MANPKKITSDQISVCQCRFVDAPVGGLKDLFASEDPRALKDSAALEDPCTLEDSGIVLIAVLLRRF
jgi:hypothetical protein